MHASQPRLFVCCIPSLDRRRLSSHVTPFLHRLLVDYPWVRLRTQPTTDLFPTLVTGADPAAHQMWQVSLKDGLTETWADRVLDCLPDWLISTCQCARHFFDPAYDLPAIPWRRRRYFNLHRFKYTRRARADQAIKVIGGVPSLFGLLGGEARYRLATSFRQVSRLLQGLLDSRYALDLLEHYAFDLLSHWNLDRPGVIEHYLRIVDDFLREAHQRCRQQGVTMVLLVPHGQEAVTASIDLRKLLKGTRVPAAEYLYYIEVVSARFWFKTERARRDIAHALEDAPHVVVRTPEELRQYKVILDGNRFGQLYAFAEHGCIFFPHDFYHPLANLVLAIIEPTMRSRLLDARHRGTHGHLPEHPAEEGYMVLADHNYQADTDWMQLIDFAPTVMALLGRDKPEYMKGKPMFRRKGASDT